MFTRRNHEIGIWNGLSFRDTVYFGLQKAKGTRWRSLRQEELVPVHQLTEEDFISLNQPISGNQIKCTWIGHSTSLVQMLGTNIIFDPIFGNCGPSVFGPKRIARLPLPIARLPKIDAVCISHNHFDHLDYNSIVEIQNRFQPYWFVPLGLGNFLMQTLPNFNQDHIIELDWWEHRAIGNILYTFVPSQHWSKRELFDTNNSLWGGWIISNNTNNQQQTISPAPSTSTSVSPSVLTTTTTNQTTLLLQEPKVYYVGDSGFCSAFEAIFQKLGGEFNLCLIPIGPVEPRAAMEAQHVGPMEAIRIHQIVHSKFSIGVHWGTFDLGNDLPLTPKQMITQNIAPNEFRCLDIGETITL